MIEVGIIGGAGYTAGELIRILINHNKVNINFVFSTSNPDNSISSVHKDLVGETSLNFTNELNHSVDVLFLCLGHGNSKAFLEKNKFSETTKIIDLSNDFRLDENASFQGKNFIYGLPELNREVIKSSKYIANPGCFATAIQLS
ncbi:MAG: N-acetyl-gamma-glutamyl-phosphate reductase, partial [Bacteroidia bacterium]|nr:N-acetyl-gamma-glutamyl-phosphate reductase [Bacteroidia bacterium]